MKLCRASTKRGMRCLNRATHGEHCRVHQDQVTFGEVAAIATGVFVGNAIAPGVGGVVVGGLAGKLVRSLAQGSASVRKRVFVSFDFDEDRGLKYLLIGQTRRTDLPYEVIDHSLKEAAPERQWEDKARRAIGRADIVLVVVGPKTHRAPGVLKEIAMARELGVKVVQMVGYRGRAYTPVPGAGRLYRWSEDNLTRLLM